MSTIVEEASDSISTVSRLVFLMAVPAVALGVMAALALQQDSSRRQPASETAASAPGSGTPASLSALYDGGYTLYIMDGADAEQQLTDVVARGPLVDWYAYVSTPEEEVELMKARDEADWVRYASGLPTIRVVDLRLASSAQAAMP